ncbi:MAG: EspA/EspE family type VII secretion system effector [Pseudonocardiaceae bacterium]
MTNPLIDSGTDVRNIYHQHLTSVVDEFVKAGGWDKGLTAVEAGEEIGDGVAQGDWAKVALGGVGAGLDMLCAGTDPIGYFSGQLVSWMMEHLEPLRKVLHALTGEPEMIKAYAASWANIGKEMAAVSAGYAAAAEGTSWVWGGPASEAYRSQAGHVANLVQAAAGAADTLNTAATMAGELVAGIRITVRDLIAALVGELVDLAAEELGTAGLATPVVVAQAAEETARVTSRVGKVLLKLTEAINGLDVLLAALRNVLDGVYGELSALAESKHAEVAS